MKRRDVKIVRDGPMFTEHQLLDGRVVGRFDERTAHAVESLDRTEVDPEQVCGHTALRALLTNEAKLVEPQIFTAKFLLEIQTTPLL